MNRKTLWALFALALLFVVPVATRSVAASKVRPHARHRGESESATLDVGFDLAQVVERENIEGACERHFARLDPSTEKLREAYAHDEQAQRDMLRCGKWLFFYTGVPVGSAIPSMAIRATLEGYPDEVGPAFTKLGLYRDPYEPNVPVGLPEAERLSVEGGPTPPPYGYFRTISCAFCHFGKLPDGRFAVGMPNERLQLGKFTAVMFYAVWLLDPRKHDPSVWTPALQRLYDHMHERGPARWTPYTAMIASAQVAAPLGLGDFLIEFGGTPTPGRLELEGFMGERPGVANALSTILGGNKLVYMTAPAIWNISNREEDVGPNAATLTNFLPARTLEEMIHDALIIQSTTAAYSTPKYIEPLAAYVRSLRAPAPVTSIRDELQVERGRALFEARCRSCHASDAGDSARMLTPERIGLPDDYNTPQSVGYQPANWLSKATVALLRDAQRKRGEPFPTAYRGIKVRRLRGVWARTRLMSNGALEGLDHALCLGRQRATRDRNAPFTEAVHGDLCDDHTPEERAALAAFLRTL